METVFAVLKRGEIPLSTPLFDLLNAANDIVNKLLSTPDPALTPEDRRIVQHRMRSHVDLIRATLGALQNEGRLRELDISVAAFSILGMVVWIARWFRGSGPLDNHEVADQVTNLAMAAVLRDARPR